MPKTPASAGGPRRVETIEMSGMGSSSAGGPTRKLEKSTSVPLQQRLKTPTAANDQQRGAVFELGAPPSRNPFQRGNTIREAVGEFVGLSEGDPAEPSVEMKQWSDRRLQYFNRKFKLSKDFVQSCDREASASRSQPQSLSPVGMMQAPPTPGLSSFQILPPTPGLSSFQIIDPAMEARARSVSIESRRPRRDSAFKIITENCASLITRGRLTPTASTSGRIRRNNAIASFSVSESPLPSSSLTPGAYAVAPSPLHPMPQVPMREPPSAERDPQSAGGAATSRPQRKRELHRLLEENEYEAMMADSAAEVAEASVDELKPQLIGEEPAPPPSTAREKTGWTLAGAAATPAAAPSAARSQMRVITTAAAVAEPPSDADASTSTAYNYPSSIHPYIASEMITPHSRDLTSLTTGTSPPFMLSRPTMLPMGDETTAQSIVTDELFFDITPPKRPARSHPALVHAPVELFAPKRGPIPLGGKVTPVGKDMQPDRVVVASAPKKVKFMEKHVPLVDTLKRQMEARWHEQKTYRTGGVGAFGECVGRKTKKLEQLPENLKRRLKQTINERPFFTYWVTSTQLLVCLVSICIFGLGEFSPSYAKKEGEVESLDRTLITVGVYEKGNIWAGPKFADLIRLGAKYSPCMRPEKNIMSRIELDRIAESYTGCCVHTDGNCYQAGDSCPRTLATLHLYRNPSLGSTLRRTHSSPDLRQAPLSTQRRSEIVCGLDPDFCASPSFHSFSREDITKWPLCDREIPDSEKKSGFRPRHLTCKVQGRPCCIHLQGRCRITTEQYCQFVGGHFHQEASLCSQVNCLHGICGMIPFGDSPNQIYRLFTSLFLHAGILHLAITIFFQMVFMRDLENYIGWKRMAFIYFISGIGGNLASAIFVPFNPEVGPSGALAGIVTTLFVDVFANRDMLEQPGLAILQNGAWLATLFLVGLLPWVDNWAILFGTVFGLLASFVFLPDVGLRRGKVVRRFIVIFGAISQILLFALLFYVFIENITIDCTWCGYFNCLNWYKFFAYDPDDGNHFCDNQGITVHSWLPI